VRIHARQIDAEHRPAQRQDELTDKRASLNTQLTELHHRKDALETEQAMTIDFTKARARARAIVIAISREGALCPTFARASQYVAATMTLLDTLPTPFTDGADKVHHQLKDILGVAAVQQAKSSLQQRAEVSTSSSGHSKASRQRTAKKLPTLSTASSLA
jgi:hypothetical protein